MKAFIEFLDTLQASDLQQDAADLREQAQLDGTALAGDVAAAGRRMWLAANANLADRDERVAVFRQHADTWRRWCTAQEGAAATVAQRLDAALRVHLFLQMELPPEQSTGASAPAPPEAQP